MSFSRNYLTGTTKLYEGAEGLETLILSSNFLSCNAARLDNAINLTDGVFRDPGLEALRAVGAAIADVFPYVDPFSNLKSSNYTNIALVYAGNSQLTSSGSSIPDQAKPGRLTDKDRIRGGRHGLFAGPTQLYELAFLVSPTFLSAYAIVALWVSRGRITEFFQGRLPDGTGTGQIILLEHMSRLPALVLFLIGAILSIVNLWCPSVFTESGSGCVDALVSTTSASVAAVNSTAYQWLWVVLVVCAWICTEMCLHQLSLRATEAKAVAGEQFETLIKCLLRIQMSCSVGWSNLPSEICPTSTVIEPRLKAFSLELVQHWHEQVF
jgi:hypothetical protein